MDRLLYLVNEKGGILSEQEQKEYEKLLDEYEDFYDKESTFDNSQENVNFVPEAEYSDDSETESSDEEEELIPQTQLVLQSNVDQLCGVTPLDDVHIIDLADDILFQNSLRTRESVPELPVEFVTPIEPNRGEKYVGTTKQGDVIWWSKPSDKEKVRCSRMANARKQMIPFIISPKKTLADTFKLFFSNQMIELIVKCTNTCAHDFYETETDSNVTHRRWRDVDADEIYAFIAINIYAGADKNGNVQARDLFHERFVSFYRATMSLKRYEQIVRFIRFDDSKTRGFRFINDPLAPIREIWSLFICSLTVYYKPSGELTIDEQLLTTRGFCPFIQYIPSKPGKYGIKIFWVVDAQNNYPLFAEIYTGAEEKGPDGRVALTLVKRLTSQFHGKGYNITMDNFFTSYALAKEMLELDTTILGTVRTTSQGLPPQISDPFFKKEKLNRKKLSNAQLKNLQPLPKKREVGSTVFCFSDGVQLTSYVPKDKKQVTLISTCHCTEEISDSLGKKPRTILDYNKFKGGVDTFDKMVRNYTSKRKTDRWTMTLFYNMIDAATLAAFRQTEIARPSWSNLKLERRKNFMRQLAIELAQPHITKRYKNLPSKQENIIFAMKSAGFNVPPCQRNINFPTTKIASNQNYCYRCREDENMQHKKRNKTTILCDLCEKHTCKDHVARICEPCYINPSGNSSSSLTEETPETPPRKPNSPAPSHSQSTKRRPRSPLSRRHFRKQCHENNLNPDLVELEQKELHLKQESNASYEN